VGPSASGLGLVAGCCEHGNEPTVSVNREQFLRNFSCCRNLVHVRTLRAINWAEVIQFTATEFRKQLQNSARYEIRVSISQPYLLFPFLSPIICHLLSSCFHSTTFPFQRCCSTSYQDLYAFNFRLGRLQSFVSKANNFFFICCSRFCYQKPCTALHSLAQPAQCYRTFSSRHHVAVPIVWSAYHRLYTQKLPCSLDADMLLVP
jgi:hypothetical protein